MDNKDLIELLDYVPDKYEDFIRAVLGYTKKKESRYSIVKEFLLKNPKANSSDILGFIVSQPDFMEDHVPSIKKEVV